jgi:hypothetical protein
MVRKFELAREHIDRLPSACAHDGGFRFIAADRTFDDAVLLDAVKKFHVRAEPFEPLGHQIAGVLGRKRQPSNAERIIFAAADDQAKRSVRALLPLLLVSAMR